MAKLEVTPQSLRSAKRIMARLSDAFTGAEIDPSLNRIGNVVRNEAIRNMTRKGLVDTGNLRASMAFRIEASEHLHRVVIGPFGVKYARLNEKGGAFTDRQRRAMFASFHEKGMKPKAGKGIINGNTWRARPFLAPALQTKRPQIIEILRAAMIGG